MNCERPDCKSDATTKIVSLGNANRAKRSWIVCNSCIRWAASEKEHYEKDRVRESTPEVTPEVTSPVAPSVTSPVAQKGFTNRIEIRIGKRNCPRQLRDNQAEFASLVEQSAIKSLKYKLKKLDVLVLINAENPGLTAVSHIGPVFSVEESEVLFHRIVNRARRNYRESQKNSTEG